MIILFTNEEFNNAKSTDLLPLKCEQCGKTFYKLKKEIKYTIEHPERNRCRFCSVECAAAYNKKSTVVTTCSNCGKRIEVRKSVYNYSSSKRFFCSHSCSASYNNKLRDAITEEQRKKISEAMKAYYFTHIKKKTTRVCIVCGKEYQFEPGKNTKKTCSKDCSRFYREHRINFLPEETLIKLSIAGRNSVHSQSEIKRSKNEMYFCKLCEAYFREVKHNEPLFNGWDADVIIEDIKYAILWNGVWHYKKILKNQPPIEQIQKRDAKKIKEINLCGYTPYIIKDMGGYNKTFVEEEFNKFIKIINIAGE